MTCCFNVLGFFAVLQIITYRYPLFEVTVFFFPSFSPFMQIRSWGMWLINWLSLLLEMAQSLKKWQWRNKRTTQSSPSFLGENTSATTSASLLWSSSSVCSSTWHDQHETTWHMMYNMRRFSSFVKQDHSLGFLSILPSLSTLLWSIAPYLNDASHNLTYLIKREKVPLDSLIIYFPLQKCTTQAPKTWLTLPLHQCRSLFRLQFLLLLHLLLMTSFNRASGICNNRSSICTHLDRYILVRYFFLSFFLCLFRIPIRTSKNGYSYWVPLRLTLQTTRYNAPYTIHIAHKHTIHTIHTIHPPHIRQSSHINT